MKKLYGFTNGFFMILIALHSKKQLLKRSCRHCAGINVSVTGATSKKQTIWRMTRNNQSEECNSKAHEGECQTPALKMMILV